MLMISLYYSLDSRQFWGFEEKSPNNFHEWAGVLKR
jgi:hypothetical protein